MNRLPMTDVLDRLYRPEIYTWKVGNLVLSWKVAKQYASAIEGKSVIDYLRLEIRKEVQDA